MDDLRDRLHISTVAESAEELAMKHSLGLEIAEFCTAYNMDTDFDTWDGAVREKMRFAERFVFHAPFNELCPAAIDPLIIEVARKRYAQAYLLMDSYGIKKFVVHSGNVPMLYHDNWFAEHAIEFWKDFVSDKPADFSLYIENLFEQSQSLLCEIVKGVADERVKLCLDIGHAALFSEDPSLAGWLRETGPHIGHVHLHNNDGQRDAHDALGDGIINAAAVISAIAETAPDATFTIESIDAEASVNWMKQNGFIS